ncbi:MAG: VirB4 family type IV secretion/conjugal transfer ATPase [Alphaproteobacteria bacterium]|nr:MAG: VirB4 family type IV secretion/conjugal transfer ATPase [Alphaproteobacteria bacterium]TAE81131.1 MAG: VirB4 family type IV secretion/conjugal transfer ATPase [Alphaproteobacteria bacterium]TAF13193.1 MAG: VirB4 family type IV secretion/conjugal transfer ATPase [Alphaproteobacteria bacterium]TAF40225.1 MAG: VirB4 family type IV secretion/conjugal transfer ATPase [Alphaproteobacteria bacterium]TAF77355.1 MAG: VirB4 family type IV secretion/conjugal transfer ATPase [Alphaproteobacteria ba
MLQFVKRDVNFAMESNREISTAEFIPYLYHYDKETILLQNMSMMQVIRMDGFSFETADDIDVDMKKLVRNSLLKSLGDGRYSMWFHIVRRRQTAYPGGKPPEGFATYINNSWKNKHHSKDLFVNELYLSVIREEDLEGAAKVEAYWNKLEGSTDRQKRYLRMQEAHKDLKETVYRILATFKDYGAEVLGVKQTEYGAISEPLGFLGRLINGGSYQEMLVPNMELRKYLPTHRLYFGTRAIEVRGTQKTKFAGIVSVKEYAPATAAGMLDAFLQLPIEFIISQSYQFHNRQTNIGQMQTRQRRMIASEDKAITQVAEISDALDMAMSGHVAFGSHHLTIFCHEDDQKMLEKSVSMVTAELVNLGINPVRERMVLEQCFWAQLPGNGEFVGRLADIHTLNMAGFASMHNYPVGRIRGNHWGDAVTIFNTTSGTPYYFNFHLRDVGHTTIIGPTGAGKTVLMNFLIAQAQKYNCRTFMFDKDRGAEIFVRALNGNFTMISPEDRTAFNPFVLPPTMENKNFLAEWIKVLISVHDEPVTAEDSARIAEAVEGCYKLDPQDRKLRNIAPFFGLEGPGTIASRLKQWHSDGAYAGLFDNHEDCIDFKAGRIFGFEMGEVLNNKVSLMPVLMYLFHRIHLSLDGTPTIIVLDEAWALIDNKHFRHKIKDWLKTLRKLNGMVVFATQSVEDATNSDISDTLIQQTATQIFLPNPKATEVYKKAFMISDREFNLLKTTDPGSRFFLVKQGKDVVVARIDLSGMEDIVCVLSGRAETVSVLDEVRAEVGNDPERWLPIFQKRVREKNR